MSQVKYFISHISSESTVNLISWKSNRKPNRILNIAIIEALTFSSFIVRELKSVMQLTIHNEVRVNLQLIESIYVTVPDIHNSKLVDLSFAIITRNNVHFIASCLSNWSITFAATLQWQHIGVIMPRFTGSTIRCWTGVSA